MKKIEKEWKRLATNEKDCAKNEKDLKRIKKDNKRWLNMEKDWKERLEYKLYLNDYTGDTISIKLQKLLKGVRDLIPCFQSEISQIKGTWLEVEELWSQESVWREFNFVGGRIRKRVEGAQAIMRKIKNVFQNCSMYSLPKQVKGVLPFQKILRFKTWDPNCNCWFQFQFFFDIVLFESFVNY